jgi:O-Antigen ligase
MILLIPFALLSVLVLPNWLLLVLGIPLGQLDYTSILSFGDVDIRMYDLMVLVITLKVGCLIVISKHRIYNSLYKAIMVFLIILLASTVLNYPRFGVEVFEREIVAFLRFLVLFIVFFLTAHSLATVRQLDLANRCFNLFGYIAAISVYLGLTLFLVGIEFGEVSVTEAVRTFGIFGDQIGFILPLFLYKELLGRRVLHASFFGIATLLTGTRGALVVLGVGLVFLYLFSLQGRDFLSQHYKRLWFVGIASGIIAVAFSYDVGGMLTRFRETEIFTQGLTARVNIFTVAVEVFRDNLLSGVGFSGFRLVASDYEAEAYTPALVATTSNQYLQVATDAGIFGIIAFLWLMKRCLQVLKQAQAVPSVNLQRSLQAAHIWLWSLLIGAQSIAWLLPDMTLSYILWIIMGMAIAARTIKDRGAPDEKLDVAHFRQGVR